MPARVRPLVFAILFAPSLLACALPLGMGKGVVSRTGLTAVQRDPVPEEAGMASYDSYDAPQGSDSPELAGWNSADASPAEPSARTASGASASVSLPAAPARQMIHTAKLLLRVANQEEAMRRLEEIVAASGGPIYSQTLSEIAFGVPPARFRATLDEVSELGDVQSRDIRGEDVTDQFVDLRLRLEVAQKARQRLLALIEARGEIKDVLEVERDIRRLTEEIEGLEGMLRSLEDRVAFSRVTVTVTERAAPVATPAPAARRGVAALFPWIAEMGVPAVLGAPPSDAPLDGGRGGFGSHGPRFHLAAGPGRVAPESFVPVLHDRDTLLAATAADDRLRVRFILTPDREAEIDFWAEAVLHELRDYLGYRVRASAEGDATGAAAIEAVAIEEFAIDRPDLVGRVLRFVTGQSGREWAYDVVLVMERGAPDRLIVAEFARERREGDPLLAEVETAIRGMRPEGRWPFGR